MAFTEKLALRSSERAFLLLSLSVLFLSGTSCLIYEIAWSRLLVQAFGSTLPAICTVLTVFLGGLALGAYISSKKFADKGNHTLLCGILELLIGIYAYFVPTIFHSAEFRQIIADISNSYIYQFLPITLLLIVPTTLMGATLPIMCRVYKTYPDDTLTLSSLAYAINTAGAVAGAALAGFVLMPALGIQQTTFVGAGINIGAALICFLLSLKVLTKTPEVEVAGDKTKDKFSFLLCVLLAASGALGMVLEIVWTRYFTLVMGSTTYAFAAVTIAVLSGLALGALVVSVGLKKLEEPLTTVSVAFLTTSFLAYLGMLSFNSLPSWYAGIVDSVSKGQSLSFQTLASIQFVTILAVVLPPTITSGIVFPLCLKSLNSSTQATPREVGKLYAVNSLGSIAGAWLAGFVFIPTLSNIFPSGIQASLFFTSLAFFALALSTFYFCLTFTDECGYEKNRGPDKRLFGSFVTVIVIFLYLQIPHWNEPLITSGLSINPVANADILKSMKQPQALGQTLFYKEGLNSTVTVTQLPLLNVNVLRNNGKAEAALPIDIEREAPTSDLKTQTLLGLLPVLFHPGKAENVLVIGFGSGATCGSTLQSGEVKNLTTVDLEKAVYEASRYFEPVNHKPLEDKRTKALTTDAVNFLAADQSYDLIISQPADPWVSGVSDLYTREFFQQASERLNQNGLFCQWIQLYDITPEYLALILNTFQTVFKETYVFHDKDAAEIIVIGSKSPYEISEQLLIRRFNEKSIRKEFSRIGITSAQQIADLLVLTPDETQQFVSKVSRDSKGRMRYAPTEVNTNDNLLTEYQLPKLLSGRRRVCEECLHMLIK